MDNFEKHKPFKEARLYDAQGDLAKRWYINFQVWSELKNKLVRKRDYSVNNYETAVERKAYAKKRIKEINQLLASGYYIKMEQPEEEAEEQLPKMGLRKAFDYVLDLKKKEVKHKSYLKIRQAIDGFVLFIDVSKKPYAELITKRDIIAYSDHLIKNCNKSISTRNSHVFWLRHIFGLFLERGWVDVNPAEGIRKMKEAPSARNKAFTEQQIKAILTLADPELKLSLKFLYYCFMRRNEIRFIQVRHINLKDRQIYIPAEASKNRKASYIILPPPLIKGVTKIGTP